MPTGQNDDRECNEFLFDYVSVQLATAKSENAATLIQITIFASQFIEPYSERV